MKLTVNKVTERPDGTKMISFLRDILVDGPLGKIAQKQFVNLIALETPLQEKQEIELDDKSWMVRASHFVNSTTGNNDMSFWLTALN